MDFKNTKVNFIEKNEVTDAYIKEISKYPTLTSEEEKELFRKIRNGDTAARERIINSNQKFVVMVAKRYAKSDNLNDLIQEGNIGLMQAIDSFDPDKDNKFISYAVWYIRREIVAYITNDEMVVRQTNNNKTAFKVNKIRNKYFNKYGHYPEVEEVQKILAEEYNTKINNINDIADISFKSIDTCYDDEDKRAFENSFDFVSVTAVENDYVQENESEYNEELINSLMSRLSEKEKIIIAMSYGIGFNKSYNNAEIGEEIGYSSERVRQLKNDAIKKMKTLAKEAKKISLN